MSCCEGVCRRYPTNYAFLLIFTVSEAVMIGFASAIFTWQGLLLAAGVTCLVVLGLTIYAFNSEVDFTGLGPYLFVGLLVIGLFGLVLALLPNFGVSVEVATVCYDLLGVLVFSFYVVFDTQLMLGVYSSHRLSLSVDDYVFAALNLYMDILNLFLHLLSLLG